MIVCGASMEMFNFWRWRIAWVHGDIGSGCALLFFFLSGAGTKSAGVRAREGRGGLAWP
jgi:hypothetical protein